MQALKLMFLKIIADVIVVKYVYNGDAIIKNNRWDTGYKIKMFEHFIWTVVGNSCSSRWHKWLARRFGRKHFNFA